MQNKLVNVLEQPIKAGVKYFGFVDDNERYLNFEVTPEMIDASIKLTSTAVDASKKGDAKKQAESVCGKRPKGFLGIKSKNKKKQIADWNKCVENIKLQEQMIQRQQAQSQIQKSTDAVKMKKIMMWGAIGSTVVIGGIVVLAIYLSKRN